MIPFDFGYLRPESLAEAITSYQQLQQEGLQPVYYAGGTEIVELFIPEKTTTCEFIEGESLDEKLDLLAEKITKVMQSI